MLLLALYSVRSERVFGEELDYVLLFRWFLDMNLTQPSFDATTFTKNRKRLLEHRIGQSLSDEVVLEADHQGLLSDEHFTVDGTLIEAYASLKSFKPKDDNPLSDDRDPGNPSVGFHGQKRSNATHQSATDSESRLCKKGKGKEAKLVLMAHALMENRNGLVTDFQVTSAAGTAEFNVALVMLGQPKERGFHAQTLGAHKGYDSRGTAWQPCASEARRPSCPRTPGGRRSAISGRTTQHPGCPVRQRIRKRVEEIFVG